jgi:hypothetical protein
MTHKAAFGLVTTFQILCSTQARAGEPVPQSLSLAQVLGHMDEQNKVRAASLAQYQCLRHYALYNERFNKRAEMTVRMTYLCPGRKTFEVLSEAGPKIIRQRVLRRMLEAEEEASRDDLRLSNQMTSENYNFTLLRIELQQGRPSFMLSVAPKRTDKFLIRGTVWVDTADYSIVRVEGTPMVNPSRFIRNTAIVYKFGKIGRFWFPETNSSATDSFLFGRTTVTIDYSSYEVNQTGALPASISRVTVSEK